MRCMLDPRQQAHLRSDTPAGIETALRDALNGEAAAQAEAKRWRAQAEEWRQKYEQQAQLVQLLRSHSIVSAAGSAEAQDASFVPADGGSGGLLEPCNELAGDADVDNWPQVGAAAGQHARL